MKDRTIIGAVVLIFLVGLYPTYLNAPSLLRAAGSVIGITFTAAIVSLTVLRSYRGFKEGAADE